MGCSACEKRSRERQKKSNANLKTVRRVVRHPSTVTSKIRSVRPKR